MNTHSFLPNHPRIFSWVLLAGLLAWPLRGPGQTPTPTPREEAFANSRVLFAAQDVDNAEKTLFATNSRQPGTAAWHLESAGALVALAFHFRSQGQIDQSILVAQRALQQLALAQTKWKSADGVGRAAAIQSLAGVINEWLSGDTNQARLYYRAAVQLDPTSPAAVALSRLEKADEEVAKKQSRK